MPKAYDELTFTDGFLFGKILCDDPELCREFAEMLLDRKIKLLRSINGESCGSALGDRINQAVQEALSKEEWRNDYMTIAMLLQDTRDEAIKEGEKRERIRSVQNIMEELHFSLDKAMNVLKLSAEEQDYCRKALNPSAG